MFLSSFCPIIQAWIVSLVSSDRRTWHHCNINAQNGCQGAPQAQSTVDRHLLLLFLISCNNIYYPVVISTLQIDLQTDHQPQLPQWQKTTPRFHVLPQWKSLNKQISSIHHPNRPMTHRRNPSKVSGQNRRTGDRHHPQNKSCFSACWLQSPAPFQG